MPVLKVVRAPEEDAKGVKPIVVTFEKLAVKLLPQSYFILTLTDLLQDRNAVLQKSKTLKGCHVVISEDFPRDVMLKRRHLIRFAKQVSIK